jgi:hypothetical protein
MGPLGGDGARVEIDETLVAGVIKARPGQRSDNKTGLKRRRVEARGKVRAHSDRALARSVALTGNG